VENSPSAFAAAIAGGYGIECDVRKSRDGRAIVFHDEQLDRLTAATGSLADLDVATITATPLRGSADCIPTLRDLLQQVAGKVPLLIEVKADPARSVAALCLAVRRELEGYAGDHAVMSFDPRVCQWFRRIAPQIMRGLVMTEEGARTLSGRVRRHRMLWQAGPDFLAYDIRDLPGAFPAAQRARGLPLLTWTVNSAALLERAAACADSAIAEGEGLA
jgi:glycerophosphoryl diester phosphodiesterase